MNTVSSRGTGTTPLGSSQRYARRGLVSLLAVVAIACGGERTPNVRESAPPRAEVDQQVPLRSVAAPPAAYITQDAKLVAPDQTENVVVKNTAAAASEVEK